MSEERADLRLAEVNVARLREPLESPTMVGLAKALDDVNWLAERSPGFVWRHRPADARLTYAELDGHGEVVVTLSVWENVDALRQYVFRSAHALFMQQRTRWFEPIGGFTTALWWVPDGTQPSVADALERLQHLRRHSPMAQAFSLGQQFTPTGEPERLIAVVPLSRPGSQPAGESNGLAFPAGRE